MKKALLSLLAATALMIPLGAASATPILGPDLSSFTVLGGFDGDQRPHEHH